ncbi:MAG: TIGR02646 family protein [Magnetococcales bacterium]|nr:TIGR02646 family protein [Magnetococcales bacterium]
MIPISKDGLPPPHKNQYRPRLQEIYQDKCAYCETKINAGFAPRIDHYRPQHFYPWLIDEWSNLVLSCERCNRIKSDQFPIQGQRVNQPQMDQTEWRANSVSFLAEQAMLIHPELEDPTNHLVFHPNGTIEEKNGSKQGKETIRICGLNREELIIARKKVVNRMRNELLDALDKLTEEKSFNRTIFKKIRQAHESHRPYSRLGWHLCEEFERFFLAQLPEAYRPFIKKAFTHFH